MDEALRDREIAVLQRIDTKFYEAYSKGSTDYENTKEIWDYVQAELAKFELLVDERGKL